MKILPILCGWFCLQAAASICFAQTNAPNPAEAADLARKADEKISPTATREDYRAAVGYLTVAAKLDPANLDIMLKLGWVYLDKLHEPDAAYPCLTAVVKHRPNDVDARKLLGLACVQTGRKHQAVTEFQAASQLQPSDLWIRANLARALARTGKYREADAMYADVLKADPSNADARLGQAELAAWRGETAAPLEMLDGVIKENPTNTDALVLKGDLQRWDWQLTGARQDYQQALAISPDDYLATDGLKSADLMGSSEVHVMGYQFKDTTKFQREYAEVGTRLHLADRAYFTARSDGWRFSNPGFNRIDRLDGAAGLEYHWARWLETSAEGNIFNYDHREAFWGGQFTTKVSPVPGVDFYGSVAENQPFISSMAAVSNALRQDTAGFGIDTKLAWRFSFQNSLQAARMSDQNTWWEDKPQISYHLFDKPSTFLRVEYDYLSFGRTNLTYWSPNHRSIVSPVLSTSIPLAKFVHLDLDTRAPDVFEVEEFGYQLQGGLTFDIAKWVQLTGSYIYSSIPGDQGAWSGRGWQAALRVHF